MKLYFILVFLFSITSFAQSDSIAVVLENTSKLNFNETIEHITLNAESRGWKVPIVHDLQKSVSKSGYDVNPVKVIEICNPHFASEILKNDESRIITPMMPLRISVYEIKNGDVVITRFNPEMVSKMFGGFAEDILLQACAASEDIVSDIIQ